MAIPVSASASTPACAAVGIEIVYHGYRRPDGRPVIAVETPDGEEIGAVRHLVRHSPTGLGWGYSGSGPADTARSLLLAALGPDGLCARCEGTGRVAHDANDREPPRNTPYDIGRAPEEHRTAGPRVTPCWEHDCEDGYLQVPYQRFKQDVVTGWGWEWHISRAEVLAWLQPLR